MRSCTTNTNASVGPEDEIELTPEMIEAGEDAIWGELRVPELGPDFSARDLAIAVWLAMDQRRKSRHL
jgi:hypothetical protein